MAAEAKVAEQRVSEPRHAAEADHRAAEAVRRVLIAAGGTGGHIFPMLTVAEELERRGAKGSRDYEILFLGTDRPLESRLIPAAGFPLRTVSAAGLKGMGAKRLLRNLLVLPKSALETALLLAEYRPDVVVGVGSYLAGPALLEAAMRDIPTVLVEPNAVPGFTNRVLAPVVRVAAVAFEEAARFYGAKAVVTGHPVRKRFFEVPPRRHEPPFTVLVIGGSQGSAAINSAVVSMLEGRGQEARQLTFIHQTGERDYNAVRDAYRNLGIAAEVFPFIEDVPAALERADLVISRAGATAVAELAAAGRASLLIPFPAATDHHQLANARAFQRAGAASVIEQAELTPSRLWTEIRNLLGSPDRLVEMERRARTLARPDAAERIASLIERLAG